MGTRHRKLEPLESGFEIIDRPFPGAANLVSVVDTAIDIDPDRLSTACRQLQQECAWLRTCVIEADDDYWYVADPTPLAVRVSPGPSRDIVSHELTTPLPRDRGPQCRITLVADSSPSTLVICIHHSLCDGNVLPGLVYRLVELCRDGTNAALDDAPAEFPTEPYTSQSRPRWPLRKRSYAWYRLMRYAVFMPKGRIPRLETVEADPAKRYTVLHDWQLDADQTRQLVDAARSNQASVTGALCAATLSVAQTFDSAEARSMRLRVNVNVSLWPLLEPPRWPTLGNFVTMIQLGAKLPREPSFWQVARQCTRAAHRPRETIRDVSMLVASAVRRRASNMLHTMVHDPDVCGRAAAVHVSNLGVVDRHRPNVLRSMRFLLAQHVAGSAFWLSAATVGGRLHGTLTTVAPLISEDSSSQMADQLQRALIDASD